MEKYLIVTLSAVLVARVYATAVADEPNPGKIPPIVPAANEIPVLGIPLWNIHLELQQCMEDAAAALSGKTHPEIRAEIRATHAYLNPEIGYVLRADFARTDVQRPLINRIVCWHDGQMIVSRISAPPLPSAESERPLAVPHSHPHQN